MICGVTYLAVALLLCSGDVALAQEDPWPPLVTTCSVMPLLAADANKNAHDLVACASTSYPICEVIDCQVLSNSDQVELELLPCWQYPAMWIKIRNISGVLTFQDIFPISRIADANVGGSKVQLNVTAVQRDGLTLGFGLAVIFPDSTNRTIFSYRDIPLNLTECPGGITPEYPLMCKMILYMEQYIISSISAIQHDPVLTPMCDKPPRSCNIMQCYWNDTMGTKIIHSYNFLRCSNPQSVRFILYVGEYVYNMTFTESKMVTLNSTTTLNFTLQHPSDITIGMVVSFIETGAVISLVPYTVIPLDRGGCPHEKGSIAKIQKQEWLPLITTCDVMPLVAADANANGPDLVKCEDSTYPNCEVINCLILPTNGQFDVKLLPCAKVPAVYLEFRDVNGTVLFKDTFSSSRMADVNIGQYVVKMNVMVVQGNGITLGFGVIATMPIDHANITIFPYRQIPLNFTECPGEMPPNYPVMCKMIDYMEQYIISSRTSEKHNPKLDATCDRPPESCDLMNCYWKNEIESKTTHTYTFHRCSEPQTVGLELQVDLHVYDMTFQESKMVVLNMTTTLNFTLVHPSNSTVGIAVTFIVSGTNNVILPYTVLPMDKNGCKTRGESVSKGSPKNKTIENKKWLLPSTFSRINTSITALHSSSSPLISTCDITPFLAMSLNSVANCSTPPAPNCNQVNCAVFGSDDTFVLSVQPCSSPSPSLQLTVRNGSGDVLFNQSISKSMQVNVQLTQGPIPVHFTIIKHSNQLTLGVSVEAEIDGNSSTTLIPYYEIPLNISLCPGVAAPTPTCAVMQNLAQYLTTSLTNITRDTEDVWNCFLNKPCLRVNCTIGKTMYYLVAISPCDKSLMMTKGYTNGTIIYHNRITGSGMYGINEYEFLTVILQYSPRTFDLELQVTVVYRDINNSSASLISPFIPYLHLPLNVTECADNKTSSVLGTYLIDTCMVMPQLASMATTASAGMLDCMSLPRPYCNKMVCRVSSAGDILSIEVLPCYHGSSMVSIVNIARDGKVTMYETISSSSNYSCSPVIGGYLGYFTITVVNHQQHLTIGLAITANLTTGNGYHNFDLIPYSEIPLDTTYCPPPSVTPTCRVMDNIAQFLNVYIKNDTHRNDGYCEATRDSFCNSIVCKNSMKSGGFNMTFLPCGGRIGYHTVDGDGTTHGYNFTIFSSGVLNYTSHIHGNITLEQINSTAVNFEVKLLVNNVFVGSEVPLVTIPVDKQVCNTSNPQTDPYALVSTCDIMPVLATAATASASTVLQCTSSSYPNCNKVTCRILSNNDAMTIELLPCYSHPRIRLTNTNSSGDVLFNRSFGNSATDITASIGGNIAVLNISVVQHVALHTLGLKIDALFAMGSAKPITLVPYYELPLDRTACITTRPNRTETCGVMDGLAQYMTVVFANSTHHLGLQSDECYADHGPYSLCNSIVCNLFNHLLFVNLTFLPCSNPVGLNFTYYSNITGRDSRAERFILQPINTYVDESTFAQITLYPRGMERVYFGMRLINQQPEANITFLEVPSGSIPLDSGMCTNNTDGHQNHTQNHNSTSLADICNIMPRIAQEVSRVEGNLSLICTTPVGDCNTLQCFMTVGQAQQQQQRLSITILPCASTPQLKVSVPSGSGGSQSSIVIYMTASEKIESVINGSTIPIYFNINQHASRLTIGVEVLIKANAISNSTLIPYKEIPLDRSTCQTNELSGACSALSNISQYMNVALSNFTAQPTDCNYTDACNEIKCFVGNSRSTLSFLLQPCDIPPTVRGAASFENGTVIFNRTIENHQVIPWTLFSPSNYLNVTLLHYNSSVVGLEMKLFSLSKRTTVELVPSTVIPLVNVDCSTSSPVVISNDTFINTCDIMPLLALSAVPLGTSDMECTSSPKPNCENITCTVPSTRDGIIIQFKSCYYPPAVTVYNIVNGREVVHHTFGETTALSYTLGGQETSLTVELYQHTDYLSLGFRVFATLSGHLTTFIPYREIPMNRSHCSSASSTPTCQIMSHISQYISVFMGNASNSPYETPDCFRDRATSCDRITCQIKKTNEVFNFTINPCKGDQVLFEIVYDNGKGSIFYDPKTASSKFKFLNAHDSSLIFNNLDKGDTVQVKVTVNAGEFAGVLIPMVTIPVDKGYCSKHGGITTSGTSIVTQATRSPTPKPTGSDSTNIIIAITVGAAGIFLLVIIILCGVVCIIVCKDRKLSNEPLSYRPLSDNEDAEDRLEYSVERSHPRPTSDESFREDEREGDD